MASPAVGPSPSTGWKAPSGKPASRIMPANGCEGIAATYEGFSTTAQPTPTAGTGLSVTRFIGRFHGAIGPRPPAGPRMMCSSGASPRNGCANRNLLIARTGSLTWLGPAAACALTAGF